MIQILIKISNFIRKKLDILLFLKFISILNSLLKKYLKIYSNLLINLFGKIILKSIDEISFEFSIQ